MGQPRRDFFHLDNARWTRCMYACVCTRIAYGKHPRCTLDHPAERHKLVNLSSSMQGDKDGAFTQKKTGTSSRAIHELLTLFFCTASCCSFVGAYFSTHDVWVSSQGCPRRSNAAACDLPPRNSPVSRIPEFNGDSNRHYSTRCVRHQRALLECCESTTGEVMHSFLNLTDEWIVKSE